MADICSHKLVYRLPGCACMCAGQGEAEKSPSAEQLERDNDEMHVALNKCKDRIPATAWRWDACKRLSNEYEMVRSVALLQPVSRAFFKLWEVMHDYQAEIGIDAPAAADTPPLTAAFLAEGPGGFVESFAAFRGAHARDALHCITLVSASRAVPGWKLAAVRRAAPGSCVKIHRGADGTGNLYRVANIDHFAASPLAGNCRLVTADGGFDFSGDFNAQESASARLLLCEAYTALRLQAPGGAFVLKIFDVRCKDTIALLYTLRLCYTDVRIVKPLTSRPANSEKYAVCTGFLGPPPPELLAAIRSAVVAADQLPVSGAAQFLPHTPTWFLAAIVHLNSTLVARQVCHIVVTLVLAGQHQRRATKLGHAQCSNQQLLKAKDWCRKYGVGFKGSLTP